MSEGFQPRDIIGGKHRPLEGDLLVSTDPAYPDRVIWSGNPSLAHVDEATVAARAAFGPWAALSMEERAEHLRR
ncbi:MAG: hypothetical protein MK089_11430, partial [Phycisphaerales bacterium]|nr:hypothetical protein [Phycisphaerales bacterium]